MIQARVKPEYRFGKSLSAFSRHEFVKDEWRDVPAEFEDEARAHEWLEVRERPIVEPGAIETLAPAPEIEPDKENELLLPVDQSSDEDGEPAEPTAEQVLDRLLGEDEDGEPVKPTADQKLDEMLEEEPEEEVKKTRRGRGGKKKP